MGNTQYILSLSYGKDSLACLEAIRLLGLPLDRIVHAEVWATDTIPADLPPMVEFKKKADCIIKERYGIEVEHITAIDKTSGAFHARNNFINGCQKEDMLDVFMDSQSYVDHGMLIDSSNLLFGQYPKLTYEKLFYRKYKSIEKSNRIWGFPMIKGDWCVSLKRENFPKAPLHKEQI